MPRKFCRQGVRKGRQFSLLPSLFFLYFPLPPSLPSCAQNEVDGREEKKEKEEEGIMTKKRRRTSEEGGRGGELDRDRETGGAGEEGGGRGGRGGERGETWRHLFTLTFLVEVWEGAGVWVSKGGIRPCPRQTRCGGAEDGRVWRGIYSLNNSPADACIHPCLDAAPPSYTARHAALVFVSVASLRASLSHFPV